MKFAAILCIAVLAKVQSQSYEIIDDRRFIYPPQAVYPIDIPCPQPYLPYPVEFVKTCEIPYAYDTRSCQGFLPPIDIRPPCPNYLQPVTECVKKTIETSYPVGPSCQNCYPQIESVKQTIEICKEPSLPVDIPCSCSRPTFPVDLPYSCSRPTLPVDIPCSCSRPTFSVDLPCPGSRPTLPVDIPCSCSRPTFPVDLPCSCFRPTLPVDIPCSCRPTPVDINCSCRPTPVDIPCSCSKTTLPACPCNLPLPVPCQKSLTIPFIDTTLEDNRLPNTLANVLQMLVASKLFPNPCLQPSYEVINTYDYIDYFYPKPYCSCAEVQYPYLYTTEYLQPVYSSPPYCFNPYNML